MNFLRFIKKNPTVFIIAMVVNIFCFVTDGYNKIFEQNITNFVSVFACIIVLYLLAYLKIKSEKK